MKRVLFVLLVALCASVALAEEPVTPDPGWLQSPDPTATSPTPDPVFVPGIDSGGAGEQMQPGPGCRLELLCVNDSYCHEIWHGFWACVWMEGSACDSIWCESG